MGVLDEMKDEEPYKSRVTFEVIPMGSERGTQANSTYDWKGEGHGLVVLDEAGKKVGIIVGHNYGREKIAQTLDDLLK